MTADRLAPLLLFASIVVGCENLPSERSLSSPSMIGGTVAKPGEFPSTVALMIPLRKLDDRFCIEEDRHCSMVKIGERHYLLAAHCFYKEESLLHGNLEREQRFAEGKNVALHNGVNVWQNSGESCNGSSTAGSWMVPKDEKRVRGVLKKIHIHPSYEARGAEEGKHNSAFPTVPIFTHHDLAVIETQDSLLPDVPAATLSFAAPVVGTNVLIGGHGVEGGFVGSFKSALKYAVTPLAGTAGTNFYTKGAIFEGPVIQPGDSGGPVYQKDNDGRLKVMGINSKHFSTASAHVMLGGEGSEGIKEWVTSILTAERESSARLSLISQ